jgi:hypothetical protein
MAINIFGFELGKKTTPKELPQMQGTLQPVKSFIPPDLEDGASVVDFVGGYGFGVQLINYDIAYRSDAELIMRYRQMAEHAEVQNAIDDIINQAIVLNERIEPVSLNLDKVKIPAPVKKKIHAEFEKVMRLLKFNTRGNELFRRWYIDGRLYLQILMNEKNQKEGIAELRIVDSTKIQKIRNLEREINENGIKFIKKIQEYYLYTAEDYIGNGKDTINYRYSTEGIILSPDSIAYINSGFIDPSTKKVLGYLHKAIKPLNQLRMLEDAVVIYRISRAPERRIFYIDVGSLPKNKSEQYLREIMQRYKNKLVYDTTTGELRDEKRHMSMLEDFWMPRREGGKGTEIQTLPGGQNLGEMQDVEFFQKKLYSSLHVPPSRFKEDTGFNMGKASEISRDEVRFAKFISRLQAKFSELFLQILRVQLISKNIINKEEWEEFSYDFSFDYATDQYFAELKENEMKLARLGTLREVEPYIGRFFSQHWVKKNILQMSEDAIEDMKKEIDREASEQQISPEQAGMPIGPDGQPLEGAPSPIPPEQPSPLEGLESEEAPEGESMEDMDALMADLDSTISGATEEETEEEETTEKSVPSKEDIEDMIDYYNEAFGVKAENPVLITESAVNSNKNRVSPVAKAVLKSVLEKNRES